MARYCGKRVGASKMKMAVADFQRRALQCLAAKC
jgi:hypothetical protein